MMTTQEAREVFQKYDCSYFLMCTRNYPVYIQYRQLEIPKIQEEVWKNEKIQMLYTEIWRTGDYRLFIRMYGIAVEFRDYEKLCLVLEALRRIRPPLNAKQRIEIAETILGNRLPGTRAGLVYWAFDNKQLGAAIMLADQALQCLDLQGITDLKLEQRIQRGRRVGKKLIKELGLNFTQRELQEYGC